MSEQNRLDPLSNPCKRPKATGRALVVERGKEVIGEERRRLCPSGKVLDIGEPKSEVVSTSTQSGPLICAE
jgi:hypothetical protein